MSKTITICSSANFYRQAVDIQSTLNRLGYKAIIPVSAEKMKETGDFNASHYRTWLDNPNDYYKKSALMKGHFSLIAKSDAVLILNYEKNGVKNYIGANVLIEMGIAFYLGKPLYVLNDIPNDSPHLEEIKGIDPIELHGKLESIGV